MQTIRLGEIAFARSGDKGAGANIGVIAMTPADYAFLREHLTAEKVEQFFAGLTPSPGTPGEGWGEGRWPSMSAEEALTLPSPGVPGEGNIRAIRSNGIGLNPGHVVRYELPNLGALNFVLPTILDGGGSVSLRIDAQGKALGQAILEMRIPAPEEAK